MCLSTLSHPTRRFLTERLERLQESLEDLGQRLRENIAQLVGTQIGEAVRDALDRLLHDKVARPSLHRPHENLHRDPRDYQHRQEHERYEDPPYWYDHDPPPPEEEPEPAPQPKPSRWKSVLTGLVELTGWWLRRGAQRPSLMKVASVGVAVGAATLLVGPFVGGVVMTLGTAILLTRFSDGVTQAVGKGNAVTTR